MTNNPIIKINGYYQVLKVAKGIWLGAVNTKFRQNTSTGISVEDEYKNVWFNTKNGLGIFKSYNAQNANFIELKYIRNANEVLCYEIAKQIGIDTAIYEPAHVDFKKGVISYNVCGENEKIQNCISFFNDEPKYSIKSILQSLDSKNINYDKQKMVLDLYKMMVFDALTFQEDRHNNNIHFIVNDTNNSIRLSPIIDNEFAFGIKTMTDYCHGFDCSSLYVYKDKFISCHGQNIIFFVDQEGNKIPRTQRYVYNVKSLISLAQKNENCKQFLLQALNNLDMVSAIEKLQDYGYQFTYDYKNYLIDLANLSKEIFQENIAELSNNKKVENIINEK